MLVESRGKLEKSQGKVGQFCVKDLADTLYDDIWNDFVTVTLINNILNIIYEIFITIITILCTAICFVTFSYSYLGLTLPVIFIFCFLIPMILSSISILCISLTKQAIFPKRFFWCKGTQNSHTFFLRFCVLHHQCNMLMSC